MADKRIQDLQAASSVQTNDLFVLEQAGAAKKLTGQILINDLATYLDGHGGISNIIYAPPVSPSLDGTLTITMADETQYDVVVKNGRGISGISWATSGTSGDGQIHTGTISYNDGTTSSVQIKDGVKGNTGAQTYVYIKWSANYPQSNSDMTNSPNQYIGICATTQSTAPTSYTSYSWYQYKGAKGDTGDSITGVSQTSTSGLVDTYTVYASDTPISTFNVTNGRGIASFVQTSGTHAAGTTDIYTITYNDGDVSTISVYNGANGLGSVSTVSGIQADGNGDVPQVVSGNGAPTTATVGQTNQLYYDLNNGNMYYCAGETAGSYSWLSANASVSVDSALSSSSENPVQNKVITAKVGTASLNTTATNLSGAVNELKAAIPAPQTSGTPANLGTAARGSAITYSRSDHVHNLPSGLVPTGGNTGQVLAKSSGSDYALTWKDASSVYVGASAPSDPAVDIWLDTDEPGMSAVSSVNGETGTVVLDASDVGAMGEWALLWTNASPASSFAAQTIGIDLSGYDAVYFLLNVSNTTWGQTRRFGGVCMKGDTYTASYVNGEKSVFLREVTVSASGVAFAAGYSGTTASGGSAVPYQIYGIKGVQ